MQTIKLNLIPGSVLPVVNVSQYDAHRQFALQVYEGAASYSLTGKTVEIRGTKPDGNGFAYDSTDGVVSVSGNTVTISTTQQMTAVGGQTMAELRITSGQTILGTINFVLDVEHSALSDDTPISETEIPVIERQLEELVEEIQVYTEDAEAWAVGERNGEPVPSSDPTYHNNAKYYASNALSSASTATTKAGEAATSATNAGNSATTASNAATTATTKAGEASTSATNAGNSATAAAADSLEAEGWAVGEQGGTPVGPTSPYYHNNAKYYSEQTDVTSLASMSDVDLTSPTNNQVLKYDAATQKWVNGTGGGGADALDDLSDVDITSAAEGNLLQYDATGQKWVNSAAIQNELAAVRDMGSVNRIVYPYAETSKVVSGVTYTDLGNGKITANTAGAASSAITTFTLNTRTNSKVNLIVGHRYILKGCPANGSGSTYFIKMNRTVNGVDADVCVDTGEGVEFTLPESEGNQYGIFIRIMSGVVANNLTFEPMLYDADLGISIPFQPYAMTNRELTEAVASGSTTVSSSYTYAPLFFQKYGGVKQVNIQGLINLPADTATVLCNLPDGYGILFDGKPTDFWVSNGVKIRIAFSKWSNNITARPYGTAINDSSINLLITYI